MVKGVRLSKGQRALKRVSWRELFWSTSSDEGAGERVVGGRGEGVVVRGVGRGGEGVAERVVGGRGEGVVVRGVGRGGEGVAERVVGGGGEGRLAAVRVIGWRRWWTQGRRGGGERGGEGRGGEVGRGEEVVVDRVLVEA